VTAVLADGFAADPVMTWVFRAEGSPALTTFFDGLVGRALLPLGATYLAGNSCAVWVPPGADPWATPGFAESFLADLGGAASPADVERLLTLGALTEQAHPPEPHWYLGMLATRTVAQGRGEGGALLRRTLEMVDREGLPAYLESTNPRNVGLYERHGFDATGTIELPDGPTLTLMWRPPGAER
jgi:GNAT superfamily N-acetyltransferase